MMRLVTVIENRVEIGRPIDEVFDYLSDPRHELEWNPKVRVMEKLTDGPIGVGTRFRAKWTKSPVVAMECTRFDRPTAWCYVNDGPVGVELDAKLAAAPSGGTVLTVRFDATPHGWMKLAFPIFLRAMRKEERRNMRLIKAQLEKA
jgi:uncharacterized protein YndB with AHSA1/START domain